MTLTMTLAYEHDLNFLGQAFQKLEPKHKRQTDTQRQTDTTECITMQARLQVMKMSTNSTGRFTSTLCAFVKLKQQL